MTWFFYQVYWAGWISMHTRKRQTLLLDTKHGGRHRESMWFGFAMLGFTSSYREGFEVVLFLQTYRIELGDLPVAFGVLVGVLLSTIVANLTFVAHRRLPYRQMLILTGIVLGGVLLVMVGEQAQEMQLAHWLPSTYIPAIARIVPPCKAPGFRRQQESALACVGALGAWANTSPEDVPEDRLVSWHLSFRRTGFITLSVSSERQREPGVLRG
jgi:high-affinity Fe2+/Pb2+ permease